MYGHLYYPHLLSSEITTDSIQCLWFFPAGILGYVPKYICDNTAYIECVFFFSKLKLCILFSLNMCDDPQ